MCHLLLLMPIIGLVVFWIWPLAIALPVYLVILIGSGVMYAVILKAMRRPVTTGPEGMIGEVVHVIDMHKNSGHVHAHGGIWNAISDDESLHAGDMARIIEVDDLTLKVARQANTTDQSHRSH